MRGGRDDDDEDDDGQNEKTMILNLTFITSDAILTHLIIEINICDELVD